MKNKMQPLGICRFCQKEVFGFVHDDPQTCVSCFLYCLQGYEHIHGNTPDYGVDAI